LQNFNLKTKLLNSSKDIDVIVTIEDELFYGYGYGNNASENDFFNIFGIFGRNNGYYFEKTTEIDYGYFYGYGFQYSDILINNSKRVNIEVVDENNKYDEFTIKINDSDFFKTDALEKETIDKKTYFIVTLNDNLKDSTFKKDTYFYNNETKQKNKGDFSGGSIINNSDFFIEINIELKNFSNNKSKNLLLKSNLSSSETYNNKIKLKAEITNDI
jgi:hypothetical protein